jgi:DivIVA domain-containing protein
MTDPNDSRGGSSRTWAPFSGDQIRRRTFRETSLGRRGYRPEDVDLFLARVAGEVERWTAAYADAQNEIYRLKNYFREQAVDPDVNRVREVSNDAVTVLARAQAHADRLIADAQAHARAMQTDARAQAEAIVVQARHEVNEAAHAYRARSGPDYNADREQAERLAALGRSILAALAGASLQMDGAGAQMRAIADAFSNELGKLTADPGAWPVDRTPPMRRY